MTLDTIAVCAIFKNEARYLMEWIGFHRMIGVDHFVLYDNGSTDGGAALIRRSPFARDVTLIDWPQRAGQLPAYADFIDRHAKRFAWAAIIDIDEFIHPLEADTLRPLLRRYGGFSSVLLHWLLFGTSGHETSPAGLALANYTKRMPESANRHVKSLLRTSDLIGTDSNPHIFKVSGATCNTQAETVPTVAVQPTVCHETIVVNHYFTRSTEDWRNKLARGKADQVSPEDNPYGPTMYDSVVRQESVEDRRITRFIPRLSWVLRDSPAAA